MGLIKRSRDGITYTQVSLYIPEKMAKELALLAKASFRTTSKQAEFFIQQAMAKLQGAKKDE